MSCMSYITFGVYGEAPRLQSQWQPPQSGYVKVNVDACLKDGLVGLGIIARDAHGSVLFA